MLPSRDVDLDQTASDVLDQATLTYIGLPSSSMRLTVATNLA
jgi:hypothetical protein